METKTKTKTEQEPWPSPSTPEKIENFWTRRIFDVLVGRRIVSVRYMTDTEARKFGWQRRPVIIELDNGERFCPALLEDSEGENLDIGEGANLYFFKDGEQWPLLDKRED